MNRKYYLNCNIISIYIIREDHKWLKWNVFCFDFNGKVIVVRCTKSNDSVQTHRRSSNLFWIMYSIQKLIRKSCAQFLPLNWMDLYYRRNDGKTAQAFEFAYPRELHSLHFGRESCFQNANEVMFWRNRKLDLIILRLMELCMLFGCVLLAQFVISSLILRKGNKVNCFDSVHLR